MDRLSVVLEQFGIEHSVVEAERKRMVHDTGYIGVWEHLQQTVFGPRLPEAMIVDALLTGTPDTSYLYPGAAAFLRKHQGQVVIMTFGSAVWQHIKARLCGIDSLAPVLVVDTHRKGELIAAARTHHGHYTMHVGDTEWTTEHIVLVDDKAVAFTGLPDDCSGYQLNNGPWYDFQRGSLPPNVQRIEAFGQIVR